MNKERSKKPEPSNEEMKAKVGYQFDKIWKNKLKTRTEMNAWAINVLGLKDVPVDRFEISKLSDYNVSKLGLKLKFEFNVVD
jgi:hypothetical protein